MESRSYTTTDGERRDKMNDRSEREREREGEQDDVIRMTTYVFSHTHTDPERCKTTENDAVFSGRNELQG
jgi:hypothetical protein